MFIVEFEPTLNKDDLILYYLIFLGVPQIAKFVGPTWDPAGADRIQVGPMLAPWTLLSGAVLHNERTTRSAGHWNANKTDTDIPTIGKTSQPCV